MTSEQVRYRVARVHPGGGKEQHWIFSPDDEVHERSLLVLRGRKPSTQRTYAYGLVDHLTFLHVHGLDEADVRWDHLQRYMAAITGSTESGIYGLVWRDRDRKPLGPDAANNVGSVLRAYYENLAKAGVDIDRDLLKSLEGELKFVKGYGNGRVIRSNPLTVPSVQHRPRILPDGALQALLEPGVLRTARDQMIVAWLMDSGVRVGGLCGLRFCDLHLEYGHACGQRVDPHFHIISREDNPNGAGAKAEAHPYLTREGIVIDGVIRMASPNMVATYLEYLLEEYYPVEPLVTHEQVLVNLDSVHMGTAMRTSRVRKMLRAACQRANLDSHIVPHAFRHRAASQLYVKSRYNAQMVADEFGWANPEMVTHRYGRAATRQAKEELAQTWASNPHTHTEDHLRVDEG